MRPRSLVQPFPVKLSQIVESRFKQVSPNFSRYYITYFDIILYFVPCVHSCHPFSRNRSSNLSLFDRCWSIRLVCHFWSEPVSITVNEQLFEFWPWLCGSSQRIQHCSRSTGHQEVSRLREWLRRWDYRGFPSRSSHQWKLLCKKTILSFAFLERIVWIDDVGIVVGKILEIDKFELSLRSSWKRYY